MKFLSVTSATVLIRALMSASFRFRVTFSAVTRPAWDNHSKVASNKYLYEFITVSGSLLYRQDILISYIYRQFTHNFNLNTNYSGTLSDNF